MLSYLRIGLPLIVVLVAIGFGSQFVSDYRSMAVQLTELNHKYDMMEARAEAYKRMSDRRDEAIGYSQCKKQIREWITHPEKMPTPPPQPLGGLHPFDN